MDQREKLAIKELEEPVVYRAKEANRAVLGILGCLELWESLVSPVDQDDMAFQAKMAKRANRSLARKVFPVNKVHRVARDHQVVKVSADFVERTVNQVNQAQRYKENAATQVNTGNLANRDTVELLAVRECLEYTYVMEILAQRK